MENPPTAKVGLGFDPLAAGNPIKIAVKRADSVEAIYSYHRGMNRVTRGHSAEFVHQGFRVVQHRPGNSEHLRKQERAIV